MQDSGMTPEELSEWEQKSKKKKEEDVARKVTDFFNSCKLQWSVTDDDSGFMVWVAESISRNVEVSAAWLPVLDDFHVQSHRR
jgi:hypothetical protein